MPCGEAAIQESSRSTSAVYFGERYMEGKITRRKDAIQEGKSSSSAGYFSTVFPPASAVLAKDLSQSDFCWTLDKQSAETYAGGRTRRTAAAAAPTADNKKQGCPSASSKEGGYPAAELPSESPYFGSSMNYGARDFYADGQQATNACLNRQTWYEPKNHARDSSSSADIATRGEWWQGSLYY